MIGHDMIGLQLESTKHQPPSCVNTFLGVDCDTSHVQDKEPYVEYRPSKGRIARILDLLAQSAKFGMSSHAAQMLKGKLTFVLQSAWGRVARAATQPLATRSGSHKDKQFPPDDGIFWTPALQTMQKNPHHSTNALVTSSLVPRCSHSPHRSGVL